MVVDEIWKSDLHFCPQLHQGDLQYSADFLSAGSFVKFLLYFFIKYFSLPFLTPEPGIRQALRWDFHILFDKKYLRGSDGKAENGYLKD